MSYEVLMATLSEETDREDLPALDHTPTPWERNQQATCECLSWRGALDNLERRHAEDELGSTVYGEFPVHARSVVVTAHKLIDAGAISEEELAHKMESVRARFNRR
jgi:Nitrile hydratase beta subunit, N-terminal